MVDVGAELGRAADGDVGDGAVDPAERRVRGDRLGIGREIGVDEEAVALGLQRTGRIVTFAALLMVIAIGCFVTASIIFIKQLGFGVAMAVLIDATIVRALLVPALMRLLGDWNWWVPRRLAKLLPATAPAAHLG